MFEADAMRFVASHTNVPIPKVYNACEKDGKGYILMSKIDGRPLWNVLSGITEQEKENLVEELGGYIKSWRSLSAEYFGSVGSGPCQDVFFQHLPGYRRPDKTYGPYRSRKDYNDGLVEALKNGRPTGCLSESDQILVDRMMALCDDRKVFSHGDLHPDNIFVDDRCKIVAILDWGASGFSIPEREYFEARSRSKHHVWTEIIDRVLPVLSSDEYETFERFNKALVLYSGV
ncbi:kinase-like protein [Eremomyces bilateralis CBS 781.70]|uniref:Kinase-like protein n=1 Tax=Eremomyces bilateralis CBS 781.70 TaxID=1392243 RepID=A0A6G1GFU5_9PEZI|nr:kinase-like protein [Eremomyces bilateralis CBS 781.70]KAF1816975.1 kinase-like protein [Eremomyces bilateralis CBS 781.70]